MSRKQWRAVFAVITILAPVALVSSAAAPDKSNIVLITIDTLRADHLGCYGYKAGVSPNLDRFAREALLFTHAYSAVPITLPSHATILTGQYPQRHGIRDNAYFPPPNSPMIQQLLKNNGYATAAFVSAAPLSSAFGLSRGFDFYDDEFTGAERTAKDTTERALQWIKTAKSPYFLWVHYFDPHAEYEPPPEFRKKFASAYDGEIAFVDSELMKLWNAAGKDSVMMITADHGESLGEHGETTHAVFVYNSTLHVPLLIRAPGIKAGVRNDPVSLSDLAPTILEVAGIKASDTSFDGLSLLTTAKDRTLFAESLYAERNFGYSPLYAAIRNEKKFILAPKPEFYDLSLDQRELRNLMPSPQARDWERALRGYAKQSVKSAEVPLPPEEQEKLRSLGYVSASVAQTGADPKLKIKVIESFRLGMILLKTEQYAQAEKRFREITAIEKQNGLGFRFLGDALSAQKKYSEASSAYSASIQKLADPEVGVQLAKAQNLLGQTANAENTLRSTITRFPHYSAAIFELASFYSSQKKWNDALNILNRDLPDFHNQRGLLFLNRGDTEKAVSEFATAIRQQEKAWYWNNLGIAYQKLKRLKESEEAYRKGLFLNPDYLECGANLAFLLIAQKRWSEAETHLSRITTANNKLLQARMALGYTQEMQGKREEALAVYRKLVADVPNNWPQRTQLQQRIDTLQTNR